MLSSNDDDDNDNDNDNEEAQLIGSEPEICRVCRSGENTLENPLFHPCKCSGSIRHVHQECLTQWLSHSKKEHCELCGYAFVFAPIYSAEMPRIMPVRVLAFGFIGKVLRAIEKALHAALVLLVWLFVIPFCCGIIGRLMFQESSVKEGTASKENMFHLILFGFPVPLFGSHLGDVKYIKLVYYDGVIISVLVVIAMFSAVVLREFIVSNPPAILPEEDGEDEETVEEQPADSPMQPPPDSAQQEQLMFDDILREFDVEVQAALSGDNEGDDDDEHDVLDPPAVEAVPIEINEQNEDNNNNNGNDDDREDDDDDGLNNDGLLLIFGFDVPLIGIAQRFALAVMFCTVTLLAALLLPYKIGSIVIYFVNALGVVSITASEETLVDFHELSFASIIYPKISVMLIGIASALVSMLSFFGLAWFLFQGRHDDEHENESPEMKERVQETLIYMKRMINFGFIFAKITFFCALELLVFPLICGILLDVFTVPLFYGPINKPSTELSGKSPTQMVSFLLSLDLELVNVYMNAFLNWTLFYNLKTATFIFLHWLFGTLFMFQFAQLVSTIRSTFFRRGVLWFVRDPQDEDFNPIREMVDKPIAFQLEKILISLNAYCLILFNCVGLSTFTIWCISYVLKTLSCGSHLPLKINYFTLVAPDGSTEEKQNLEASVLDHVLNVWFFVVPLVYKKVIKPMNIYMKVWSSIIYHAAHRSSLKSFFFGYRFENESETAAVSYGEHQSMLLKDGREITIFKSSNNGGYKRVLATDDVTKDIALKRVFGMELDNIFKKKSFSSKEGTFYVSFKSSSAPAGTERLYVKRSKFKPITFLLSPLYNWKDPLLFDASREEYELEMRGVYSVEQEKAFKTDLLNYEKERVSLLHVQNFISRPNPTTKDISVQLHYLVETENGPELHDLTKETSVASTICYCPPNMRLKVYAFLFYLWLFSFLLHSLVLHGSIVFGRLIMSTLFNKFQVDSVAFLLGSIVLLTLYYTCASLVVKIYEGFNAFRNVYSLLKLIVKAKCDIDANQIHLRREFLRKLYIREVGRLVTSSRFDWCVSQFEKSWDRGNLQSDYWNEAFRNLVGDVWFVNWRGSDFLETFGRYLSMVLKLTSMLIIVPTCVYSIFWQLLCLTSGQHHDQFYDYGLAKAARDCFAGLIIIRFLKVLYIDMEGLIFAQNKVSESMPNFDKLMRNYDEMMKLELGGIRLSDVLNTTARIIFATFLIVHSFAVIRYFTDINHSAIGRILEASWVELLYNILILLLLSSYAFSGYIVRLYDDFVKKVRDDQYVVRRVLLNHE